MNLILFPEIFEQTQLAGRDPRAKHLREVVRVKLSSQVFVGFINGPRARAEVTELADDGGIVLTIVATEPAPVPLPIALLVGLPRPHTAKRILFEASSMGVDRIHFFETEKGEPSYAQSSLWRSEEWRERVHLGVEQSFGTHVPDVAIYPDLQTALSAFYNVPLRIVLDNYEAASSVSHLCAGEVERVALAFGSERGWSENERTVFRQNGWKLAHLGAQVLRAETAVVAGISAVASGLNLWKTQTQTQL
ncbi:MAG: RsmE family RNA methyltransferase [Verrucomicrobiota bacterium]